MCRLLSDGVEKMEWTGTPALIASKKFRTQNSFGKDTYGGCVSFSGLAHRLDDELGASSCGG
jgi:hypothetical protein